MDRQSEGREVRSLSETMEKYSHVRGSTPREKVKNAYAQLRARQQTPAEVPSVSVTPSSNADIEYTAPETKSDNTAPLSVRVDKEPVSQIHHPPQTEAHSLTAETLLHLSQLETPVSPALQTVQPSALAVTPTEKSLPGSIQLGPSEYAVALPMDSRIRDDYDRVLMGASQDIQAFLNPDNNIHDDEVSRFIKLQSYIFAFCTALFNGFSNICPPSETVWSALAKDACRFGEVEQHCDSSRSEHGQASRRRRIRS